MALVHHPYFKLLRPEAARTTNPNVKPWTLPGLCTSYDWPMPPLLAGGIGGSTGEVPGGGVIGLIELGGGYYPSDLSKFFSRTKLPPPNITNVSVDSGATNSPGSDADVEVALDIQVAGGAYARATGKPAMIRVYWANNDLDAITRAIIRAAADGCDTLGDSWGSDEASFGAAAAQRLETAAANAAAGGMVTFAASGDNDSSDGGPTPANVDLPASAPHVVGCGGTMRPRNSNQQTNPETVWNNNPGQSNGEGTGGGYSTLFARPAWQVASSDPAIRNMRMVPDIAANADPNTGYHIIYQGQDMVVGGTSAVAPLYAGLFAAFGQKLGFINPTLWANPTLFRQPIPGNNGLYHQPPCPGPCTGLGTPFGTRLAGLFVR
jgi:kumamolisin